MTIYNGFLITTPVVVHASRCGSARSGQVSEPEPAVTTYQYRILATGAVGETTSLSSIPANAVVIGVVTA
jgi:hypothetical protein